METDAFELSVGDLGVRTTHNRGHTVEEVAEMATNRLISVETKQVQQVVLQYLFQPQTQVTLLLE